MTTLVTGATGFVGSAVARQLLDRGETVRVLARPGGDRRNIEGLSVEIAEGDLRDRASLERALAGCDALFHVAADYRLWVPRPDEIYEANVAGTCALMLAAGEAGVKRIVYTSSVATLGIDSGGAPSDALIDRIAIIGSAEECRERVRAYAKGGITTHIVQCLSPDPAIMHTTFEAFTPQRFSLG